MKDVADSEWEETLPLEGPGRRLQILREAQELGRPRAASLLHLDDSKLEALEKDDYEKLPGSVFVRGYLKNYARLLNVPADQILAQYDRIKPAEERRPNLQISSIKHEVGSGHLFVRLMTWGITISLIALAVIWWRGQFHWPLLSETTNDSVDVNTEVHVTERADLASFQDTYDNQPVTDDSENNLILPLLTRGNNHVDSMLQDTAVHPPEGEGEKIVRLPNSGNTDEPLTSEPPILMSNVDKASESSSSRESAGDITIELIADCWVSIRDASGSFKIRNVLKQGTQSVLKGHPPYKIILGRASAVRLKVKGKVFDLAPYTKDDVARLTLNPDL